MSQMRSESSNVTKVIAVFGAGSGLGQAVARKYVHEGYTVVLVARRREYLDRISAELSKLGANVHVITGDLSQTGSVAYIINRIHDQVGNLDAFYYAPTPDGGFIPAERMTAQQAQDFMPLIYYTFVTLVQEFLPHMLKQSDGAILTAQGASTLQGLPHMSGPGPAQAAQRNYLQSLHAEVARRGIYIGMLYVGAAIKNSAFHQNMEKAKTAGEKFWEMAVVDPDYLADLLWKMQRDRDKVEVKYP
jgi:short-subunit dehydrogenase